MNYERIYNNLINRAKKRILEGYVESHHIIPRCMGGGNNADNLVILTPEEHYLAHQLLIKIYPSNYKLKKAAAMMSVNRPTNKLYGWIRRQLAEAQSICQRGKNNSQYGTKWICNGTIEKKISKNEEIPDGWCQGRLYSMMHRDVKTQRINNRLMQAIERKKYKDERRKELEERKKEKLTKTQENKIKMLKELHEIYKIEGFEGVKSRGYKYSQANLVTRFAKYLPEFVAQNGKKRKI